MGTKTHACGIDTNPKKKNMFALTSSSSAIARSRVASAAAGRSSRLKVIAKKNCDSAPIRILSTKDKEVALKATLLMANKSQRATSVIVNSTASGANPEPTMKAGGIADWPLEKKFAGFCFAMFGFFAYFKQVPAMLCGHLALFINVTFFSPVVKIAW